MEAVGEREKVAVMGKMRDTGRMVVKDSETGETVKVMVVGELPKKTLVGHPVPAVLSEDLTVMQALDPSFQ